MKRSIALLSIALVLAACGGGGQQASSAAPASAAATTAATTAPTTAPTAAATADADKALLDALRARSGTWKVTYEFTLSSQPGVKNIVTQYFKAPNFRQDLSTTVGGQQQSFTTIINSQGTFTCGAFGPQGNGCINFGAGTPQIGAPTGGGTTGGPGASGPMGAPTDLTGFNLAFTTTRTVAGQSTRCYNFSGTQTGGAEVIGCYNAQAVPLYMSVKAAGQTTEMTATSFSTNVTDADFALPYPVTQIPGFPVPSRP